jgi:hypothetical protein
LRFSENLADLFFLLLRHKFSYIAYVTVVNFNAEKRKKKGHKIQKPRCFEYRSGKEDIKWIEVSNTDNSNRLISVNKVNGNAAFFGIQYYSINSTVSYCNISKGGMKLEKIMKLDSEYRKRWFSILQPKTFRLNAGTNDRIDTNVQQFKKQINQYITDFKSGSPDTKMILIEPNQPEDHLTTNAIYFEKARK